MAQQTFIEKLRRVHDLMLNPDSPQLQALQLYARNSAQLDLMIEALDGSGCMYSVLDSQNLSESYRWLIIVTGTQAQLQTFVETILGY